MRSKPAPACSLCPTLLLCRIAGGAVDSNRFHVVRLFEAAAGHHFFHLKGTFKWFMLGLGNFRRTQHSCPGDVQRRTGSTPDCTHQASWPPAGFEMTTFHSVACKNVLSLSLTRMGVEGNQVTTNRRHGRLQECLPPAMPSTGAVICCDVCPRTSAYFVPTASPHTCGMGR